MKKREFPASFPLLGLLTFGPQSGYDLRKTAEATLGPFWHEGFAQVYASLDVFEAQGLAVAELAGSRKRKVYRLTESGRQAFLAWLEQPVPSYDFRRHELLVKVFFGRLLAPQILGRHLDDYSRLQAQGYRRLEALAASLSDSHLSDPDLPYWLATVEHGACLGRSLEAWCRQTRRELVDRASESQA